MSRCPNCGQSSKSDFCEWCGYPINVGGQIDKDKAKRESKEAKKARQAQQEAKKDINVMKDLVTESKVNAAYEGIVRIVLPQANLNQVKIVEQYLLQIQNLRLLLVGGSVEAGSEFIVSADKPVPLTSLLERIDFLEGVVAKGNCIQLTMRS